MATLRQKVSVGAFLVSVTLTLFGLFGVWQRVRTVDWLLIYAGGILLGVTLSSWVRAPRPPRADFPPAPKSGA